MGCCSQRCRQFMLLVWKNFKLQIRRPIGTVFELLIPPLAVLFVIGLRFGIPRFRAEDRCFVTFDSDTLTVSNMQNYTLFYAPRNQTPDYLIHLIRSKLPNSYDGGRLIGVDTEEDIIDMIDAMGRENLQPFPIGETGCFIGGAGIVFDNLEDNTVEYTLRLRHEVGRRNTWFTQRTAAAFQLGGPRISNFYLSEGFLHLENIVGLSIVEWKSGKSLNVTTAVRQLPQPPYSRDLFLSLISFILPFLLLLAFLYSAGVFVKELVLEKETRIRESMLMMGLSQWVLWSTWYLKQFIFLFISVIIMTVLLKVGRVFPISDFILLLIFFTLFILSMISFGYLVSVWFNSARIGLLVGFLAWFINYFPFLFLASRYDDLSLGAKVGVCFLSNTCVGFGVEVLSRLELRQEGLTWSNAALPLSAEDSFNMAWVYGMLALDSILYMVLAWYVNGVKPGEYGVPKPFYFPCLPSYWTGSARKQTTSETQSLIRHDALGYDPSAHEEEPSDLKAGISIRSLTKIYNQSFLSRFFNGSRRRRQEQRKVAVDELSLNMYKGQITALLGHNGAGKTTTMSILTGLYTPTSGTALVNGYDILENMDQIRESLGICPQHNVLFDRLTVAEHLSFFTRLKGVWGTERVNEEVGSMMADLQLLDKRNIPASKLSGGMKRKLSVGIALIGGSEVVVLDEPTSGMDPYARRATWDLLVKHKQGRTMLLTTHHMDEADLLGDRIAILAEGKLRCSGSSLFLKSRYGVGYHMTMVKEPKCDSAQVTHIVQSVVCKAEQVTDVGAELSFILPSSATAHFPQLFDTLESRKAELGISSFGVSVTTMEEVFMKVGEGTEETLETRVMRSASPQATSPFQSPAHRSPGLVTSVTIQNSESANMEVQEAVLKFRDEDNTPLPGQVGRPSIIDIAETVIGPNNSVSKENDSRRLTDGRPHYLYTPNRGVTLWIQQFWAMFLKRFYNSVRFFGALFSQFLLPMLFVLCALVLAVTIPNPNQDDPRRALLLENSALSDSITVFYVQFGDEMNSPLNFSSVDASTLGVTEFLDYAGGVQAVIDATLSDLPNSTRQCCKYRYQLLDQYCATREVEDLVEQCSDSDTFGFNTCKQCLSCCMSRQAQLPSCSNPLYQLLPAADVSQFCPAAPQVAFSSMSGGSPSGKLESSNIYVAERLLTVSEELQPAVFYQRFQAGFSVTRRDPPYSVCSCSLASETCNFISPLRPESGGECAGQYSIPRQCNLAWAACIGFGNCRGVASSPCQDFDSPSVSSTGSISGSSPGSSFGSGGGGASGASGAGGAGGDAGGDAGGGAGGAGGAGGGASAGAGAGASCSIPLPGCYVVDGFSANVINNASCSNPMGLAPTCTAGSLPATYPDQTEEVAVTVWYNNQPYHMSAAALNAFHSLLLKQVTGNNSLSITVYNHPLPRNITAQADTATRNNVGFGIGSLVVFGYSFLLASFVLFLVKEKESKAKHLQFVSGVHTTSYWLANLTWDLLNGAVPIIISFILFAAFQVEAYTGEGLAAVLLLFIFTTWSSIPLTYCFSFLFSNSLAAYGLLMILFFFVGLLTQVVVILVDAVVADIIHYIFLVFPTYGLAIGFNDIYINQISKDICTASVQARQFCELPSSPIRFVDNILSFERPGIGVIITYMAVEGVLFFILTLLIERSWFFPEVKQLFIREENSRNGYASDTGPLLPGEDSDVSAERKRVTSGATTEDEVIVIKNLAKEYSSSVDGCSIRPSKLAVGGISVAIPSAECFGLLGVNGAGKTTTFSILTGDITMTSGTAVIAGYDIRTHLRDVQQRIGYCPQFDALIERLTGREILTMFARLRGIPEGQIKEVVETEITRLDLSKHADKRCGRYSGGNKRKLSTAIALVGNPPIVLLDEPTTGMDPTTRRYLWDVLTGITQEGRSIVLTSHSMEECEALCTRLAIMVNGYFKCLGSIQHLKNKYGSGYTLQVKVKLTAPPEPLNDLHRSSFRNISLRRARSHHDSRSQTPSYVVQNPSIAHESIGLQDVSTQRDHTPGALTDTTSLHTFVRETFPGALLLEEHQGAVTYQLPSANTTWSTVFRQLENNKGRLNIIDYSVSQTTLEQVFINFAKEQEDSDA